MGNIADFFNKVSFEAERVGEQQYIEPDEAFEVEYYIYDVLTLATPDAITGTLYTRSGRTETELASTVTISNTEGTHYWTFSGNVPASIWNGELPLICKLEITASNTFIYELDVTLDGDT